MNGHKVGRTNQVGSGQRAVAKAQVRAGVAARLLRVVVEISLAIFIGVVANNLDAVLVSTYSTVGTQAVEFSLERTLGQDAYLGQHGQRLERNIIDNTDGELVLLLAGQIVVHRDDLCGGGILAAEAVATADDAKVVATLEGLHDVQIQRVAVGAGLFGTVEHADVLCALRHHVHQVFHAERTVEVYGDNAHLLALSLQVIHHGFNGLGNRTHGHNHIGGIGCAVVGEGLVGATAELAHLVHVGGHNLGQRVVVLVLRLAGLEVDVGVLSRTTGYGMLGVQGAVAISLQGFLVD